MVAGANASGTAKFHINCTLKTKQCNDDREKKEFFLKFRVTISLKHFSDSNVILKNQTRSS